MRLGVGGLGVWGFRVVTAYELPNMTQVEPIWACAHAVNTDQGLSEGVRTPKADNLRPSENHANDLNRSKSQCPEKRSRRQIGSGRPPARRLPSRFLKGHYSGVSLKLSKGFAVLSYPC